MFVDTRAEGFHASRFTQFFQNGLGEGFKKHKVEKIAEDTTKNRKETRKEGEPPPRLGPRLDHRHQHQIRWDEKEDALNERNPA